PTAAEMDHEFDGDSRVETTRLSAEQVENLALLGKVWGFVKYHHPRVTGAELNWDYELFRVLPSMLRAEGVAEAAWALSRWLEHVGEPVACKECAGFPDSTHLQPPIEWIRDRARLGEDLSGRLERIHANRHAHGEQYYVVFGPSAANPDFSNEASYPEMTLPDAGYRLLALFRFWNMIEYWFPYRGLIPEDWGGVLTEFVPRLMQAATEDEYRLAMIELVARVHDGHANLWSAIGTRPPRGECQVPVAVRSVEGRFTVGAYADSLLGAASGLKIGDVIVTLDGLPVDSLAAAWAPYYGASNDAARRRDIARSLTKGDSGACRLTIERSGKRLEVTATRDSINRMDPRAGLTHDLPGETFRLLSKDIAYLKIGSAAAKDAAAYFEKAAVTRCLVLDIRNYPREYLPFALGQHLVEQPTPFVRFTRGDPTNPGAFVWLNSVSIQPEAPHYTGKVVILVDEVSQSAAEYVAMAMRAAPGAIVVGSTTAGADGNFSAIRLPGGLRTMISGIGIFYPDKTPTQQVGIVPDLVVHPTVKGIREGRDEVLEAALKKALGREVLIPIR
ncbi:MAG TPA: S41 family peptidase, partial [Thermoplasmata archaeon]|nr:S41 family peptidase [Thermoplasmata archaeon]